MHGVPGSNDSPHSVFWSIKKLVTFVEPGSTVKAGAFKRYGKNLSQSGRMAGNKKRIDYATCCTQRNRNGKEAGARSMKRCAACLPSIKKYCRLNERIG